jgi:hypothetical protein
MRLAARKDLAALKEHPNNVPLQLSLLQKLLGKIIHSLSLFNLLFHIWHTFSYALPYLFCYNLT